MPFENEHACRLRDPDSFQDDSFRRVSRKHDGKEYDIIMGRLEGEETMTEQAYRYPKETWTVESARSHCEDHDGIDFEPAAEEDSVTAAEERVKALRESLPDTEYRFLVGEIEVRQDKKGFGIAGSIPFNSESEDLGFVETISPRAFNKTIKEHDIVSAWNHDPLWVLGRRSNDTLKFAVHDDHLEYDVSLDEEDSLHRHFARRVERRDVTGSSFTFSTIRDEWDHEEDPPKRKLLEVKMYEIGPVTFPAYRQSDAQARALCDVASVQCGEDLDLTQLAQAVCRSRDGKFIEEDIELAHRWLERLVEYLPREDAVSRAEMKVRKRQLRQLEARYGLS